MGFGSGNPQGHPGSLDAGQFELYDGDPSVDGLARPEGWRVGHADGTGAWDKTGPADTDWTRVAPDAGGDVTTVNAGDTFVTITNPGGPVVTVGQRVAAAWTIDRMRIYAVDGVNGNDANAGFADPASASVADYRAAVAAAGLVAKKTVAGLAAIFPRIGNGRMVEVVFARGTYAGSPADFLNGTEGYVLGCPIVRGTATATTAGAVAFAGSDQDLIFSGGTTATGLNADGYTDLTTFAAPDAEIITDEEVTTGNVPVFGAQPALPLGLRLRFKSSGGTAAIRNEARQICEVTPASRKLYFQTVLSATPANTDIFYLEQPGVVFSDMDYSAAGDATFVGLRHTGTVIVNSGRTKWVFCEIDTLGNYSDDRMAVAQDYEHPVVGPIMVGGGLRVDDLCELNFGSYALRGLVVGGQLNVAATGTDIEWDAGCAAENVVVSSCSGDLVDVSHPNFGFSNSASGGIQGVPQIFGTVIDGGPLQIRDSRVILGRLKIPAAGGQPAITVWGKSVVQFVGEVSGAAGGNADVGLDLQSATDSDIIVLNGAALTKPTVTGTLGDLRLAGNAIDTWAALDLEDVWDIAGNHVSQTLDPAVEGGVPQTHRIDRSATIGENGTGATLDAFTVVRSVAGGASLALAKATPATVEPAAGLFGILRSSTPNGSKGLVAGFSGVKVVKFESAPTVGAIAYLHTTGGLATTTPPTGVQFPIGIVVGVRSGVYGIVRISLRTQNPREEMLKWAQGFLAETCPRATNTAGSILINQSVYYMAIYLFAGETLTNVSIALLGAGVGVTKSRIGLYKLDGTLVASTADQGTSWQSTGLKTMALSSPYTVAVSGVYYLAILATATGTLPAPLRSSIIGPTSGLGADSPSGVPYMGVQTGQTDLPNPGTIVAGTSPGFWWIGVS